MAETTYILRPWMSRGPIVRDTDGLELLEFDAAIQEQHTESVSVSGYPVEDDTDAADHIEDDPIRLSMSVMFTDTPDNPELIEDDRARVKHRALVDMMRNHELVDIQTGLKSYVNMVLERVSVTRTSASGYAVAADVEFVELRVAERVFVKIPERILATTVKASGQSQVDRGRQQTKEAQDATSTCEGVGSSSLLWKRVRGCSA